MDHSSPLIRKGWVGRERVHMGHAMYLVEGYRTMQIRIQEFVKGIETLST